MEGENPFLVQPRNAELASIRETAETPELDPSLARATQALERNLGAYFERLPADHPVQSAVQACLDELFPGQNLQAVILDDNADVNAFSLANGHIYITRGMLKFLDSYDQLRFVLAHEGIHATHQHVEHVLELDATLEGRGFIRQALSGAGMLRTHEYEADIRGVLTAAHHPFHLDSVRRLLLRFSEIEKTEGTDLVHGSSIERIINIGGVARLKDLASHRASETPLPAVVDRYLDTDTKEPRSHRLAEALLGNQDHADMLALPMHELGPLLNKLRRKSAPIETQALDVLEKVKPLSERFPKGLKKLATELRSQLNAAGSNEEMASIRERWFWQGLAGLSTEDMIDTPALQDLAALPELDAEQWKEVMDELVSDPLLQPQSPDILTELFEARVVQTLESGIYGDEEYFNVEQYFKDGVGLLTPMETALSDDAKKKQFRNEALQTLFSQALLSVDTKSPAFEERLTTFRRACHAVVPEAERDLLTLDLFSCLKETVPKYPDTAETRDRFYQDSPLLFSLYHASQTIEALLKTMVKPRERQIDEYPGSRAEPRVPELDQLPTTVGFYDDGMREKRLSLLEEKGLSLRTWDDVSHMLERLEPLVASMNERLLKTNPDDDIRKASDRYSLGLSSNETGRIASVVAYIAAECRLFVLDHIEDPDWDVQMCKIRRNTSTQIITLFEEISESINTGYATISSDKLFDFFQIVEGTHSGLGGSIEKPALPPLTGYEHRDHHAIMTDQLFENFYVCALGLLQNKSGKDVVVAELSRFAEFFLRYTGAIPVKSDAEVQNREKLEGDGHAYLALAILSRFSFDTASTEDQRALLAISHFVPDPFLRNEWQKQLIASITRSLPDGNARLQYCLEDPLARASFNMTAIDRIIEDDLTRPEDLSQAGRMLESHMETALDEHAMGAAAVLSALPFKSKDAFLKALIEFRDDDQEIKAQLFEILLTDPLRKVSRIRDIPTEDLVKAMLETEAKLDRFQTVDDWTKYVLLRNILVGEHGVLLHERRRRETLEMLLDQAAAPEDDEEKAWHDQIRSVIKVLAKTIDPDQLFLAIAPLLQKQILLPSQSAKDWSAVLDSFQFHPKKKKALLAELEQERVKRVEPDGSQRAKNEEQLIELIRDRYITEQASKERAERWNVSQFLIEIARNLGTPGTRFLQLMGQYMDLPPKLQASLQDIYDQVPGQSKLTAADTTQREWTGSTTELQNIRRRIGGGSIFSAYETEAEGQTEVLKVLAPNAHVQNTIAFRILERVAQGLIKKNPAMYASLPTLIDDLRLWIEGDLHDPDFLEQDKQFRERHHGFAVEGNPYHITVPETRMIDGKDNPYLKREEFVDGVTWNRWKGSEEERKAVVSLLTHSLLRQFASGQVHSDVHPGNIMVTNKNEVAIIDRHHFLMLTEIEQLQVQELFATLAGTSCENLLRALDSEVQEDAPVTRRIDKMLKSLRDEQRPAGVIASTLMRMIQQAEIRPPINFTLMVKNLLALNRMAQQSGFRDVQEALMYSPGQT